MLWRDSTSHLENPEGWSINIHQADVASVPCRRSRPAGALPKGENIIETFKAVIVLVEVLNRLSIRVEILGFNRKMFEYLNYNQDLDDDTREKMIQMLAEVH